MPLRILVSDLLGNPGSVRTETGRIPLDISLTDARVDTEGEFDVRLQSLSDGLVARGDVRFDAELTCNRCLTTWVEQLEVPFEQVFRYEPQDEDDEMQIENGAWIDLEPVLHDEATLALPLAPVCRPDCLGLCPTCGADLNSDPCDGHDDPSESPFAVLKDLLDD